MSATKPRIAIACGGTGGHTFPGLAVAHQLTRKNCDVTLIISEKEVDRQAVQNVWGMEVAALPGVGLSGGNFLQFGAAFLKSYTASKNLFQREPVRAVLSMGGFMGVGPIAAAKKLGVLTFLHESNSVPGRANRWLSRFVNRVFIGFTHAESQFPGCEILDYGNPVRQQFLPRDPAAARNALHLDLQRPTIVVMGGSQGASGINDLVIKSLPVFVKNFPELQWFHLTGAKDEEKVRAAYAENRVEKYVVKPFFTEMETALAAASVAISRAGASSLAEIAAMRVPSILIPYPAAVDNHQLKNAQEFTQTGAAKLMEEHDAKPEDLCQTVMALAKNEKLRESLFLSLKCWHRPRAAEAIADEILRAIKDTPPKEKKS